jgi:hypothetical protein
VGNHCHVLISKGPTLTLRATGGVTVCQMSGSSVDEVLCVKVV